MEGPASVPVIAQASVPVAAPSGSPARTNTLTQAEDQWLKDEVKKLPGYAKFEANRARKLQNIDRVEYWRFAFIVDKKFFKTSWPSEISSRVRQTSTREI